MTNHSNENEGKRTFSLPTLQEKFETTKKKLLQSIKVSEFLKEDLEAIDNFTNGEGPEHWGYAEIHQKLLSNVESIGLLIDDARADLGRLIPKDVRNKIVDRKALTGLRVSVLLEEKTLGCLYIGDKIWIADDENLLIKSVTLQDSQVWVCGDIESIQKSG